MRGGISAAYKRPQHPPWAMAPRARQNEDMVPDDRGRFLPVSLVADIDIGIISCPGFELGSEKLGKGLVTVDEVPTDSLQVNLRLSYPIIYTQRVMLPG